MLFLALEVGVVTVDVKKPSVVFQLLHLLLLLFLFFASSALPKGQGLRRAPEASYMCG